MRRYLRDFIKFSPLLFLLIGRDFKVKYRRSILGVLWSMLNPLLIMFVVSSVFAVILKVKSTDIKMPFAVFYISGSLIFNFFSEATTSSMTALISNAALIQKVYIPKYIFILEKCIFSLINMLFSAIAVLIVVGFYAIKGEVEFHLTIFLVVFPMFFSFLFSVGVSLIVSTLTVFFRDIVHIWGIIITIWLYLTPIVYPMEILEFSKIGELVRLNPIYYFVDDLRNLMILGQFPKPQSILIEIFSSLAILFLGLALFKKKQNKFILYI